MSSETAEVHVTITLSGGSPKACVRVLLQKEHSEVDSKPRLLNLEGAVLRCQGTAVDGHNVLTVLS